MANDIRKDFMLFTEDDVAFRALTVGEQGLVRALYRANVEYGISTPVFSSLIDTDEIEDYSKTLLDNGFPLIDIDDRTSGLMRELREWSKYGWKPIDVIDLQSRRHITPVLVLEYIENRDYSRL